MSSWQTAHPSVLGMCLTVRVDGSPLKEPTTMMRLQFFFLILICMSCPFSSSLPFGCTSPIFCFDAELPALQFTFFSIFWFSNISIISQCFTSELISFILVVTSALCFCQFIVCVLQHSEPFPQHYLSVYYTVFSGLLSFYAPIFG